MSGFPRSRYVLFILPAVLGCAIDLATKSWIFSWPELRAHNVRWLWPRYVGIQLIWNEGALFGMGQGRAGVFAALSVAAAIAIPVWLFRYGAARSAWLTLALGCVMGGVVGNLFDRLGLHGQVWPPGHEHAGETIHAVRDWILWQINDEWRWPNFNIADSLLVVGAGILFFHALRRPMADNGVDAGDASRSPCSRNSIP